MTFHLNNPIIISTILRISLLVLVRNSSIGFISVWELKDGTHVEHEVLYDFIQCTNEHVKIHWLMKYLQCSMLAEKTNSLVENVLLQKYSN